MQTPVDKPRSGTDLSRCATVDTGMLTDSATQPFTRRRIKSFRPGTSEICRKRTYTFLAEQTSGRSNSGM